MSVGILAQEFIGMSVSLSATVLATVGSLAYLLAPRWGSSHESEAAVIEVLRQQLYRCGPGNLTCPPAAQSCPATHLFGALVVGSLLGFLSFTWCGIGWYIWRWSQVEKPAGDSSHERLQEPWQQDKSPVTRRRGPLAIELSRDAIRDL